MRKVQGDPKRLLHITTDQELEISALAVLAQSDKLFVRKIFRRHLLPHSIDTDAIAPRIGLTHLCTVRRRESLKVNLRLAEVSIILREKVKPKNPWVRQPIHGAMESDPRETLASRGPPH